MFMYALFSAAMNDGDKSAYFYECKKLGITLTTPCVHQSLYEFTPCNARSQKNLIFGLGGIKNLPKLVIDAIVQERKQGLYKDLCDFFARLAKNHLYQKMNTRSVEALVYSGALDVFKNKDQSREVLYTHALACFNFFKNRGNTVQLSMPKAPNYDPVTTTEILGDAYREEEYLGCFTTIHPVSIHQTLLKDKVCIQQLYLLKGLKQGKQGIILSLENAEQKLYAKMKQDLFDSYRTHLNDGSLFFFKLENKDVVEIAAICYNISVANADDLAAYLASLEGKQSQKTFLSARFPNGECFTLEFESSLSSYKEHIFVTPYYLERYPSG